MKLLTFTKRNIKEILRDPLTFFFGLGFPVILLLLLSAIQANIPVELFAIESLAPGIVIFGLSFITLFSSLLVAKDRESDFIMRLYASPLKATDYILGYTLSLVPVAVLQTIICYVVALILGLPFSFNIIVSILVMIPISFIFIMLGLLFGSVLNVKQAGGICGALLTNLTAYMSGIWFDLELVGSGFKFFADLFPFSHCVNINRSIILGAYNNLLIDALFVIGYVILCTVIAILLFYRQMRKK